MVMRRYLTVAVLGILVLAPSLASAQIFSFGRNRGGNYYYDNYGYPSYGWGGYRGYNRPYGMGWNGWDYSYPGTGSSYSYQMPSNSSPYAYDQSYSGVYQAGYNTPMGIGNRVRLQVIVPDPNAELLIQGERMNTMGPNRMFISPDLEPSKTYSYTIVLRRPNAGAGGEEKRTVDVQAGGTYTIDFSRPSGERMQSNERLPAPKSDYSAPSSERPKSDIPPSHD
jgi:uncharacterized protein (TIGR03000 family)